MTRMGKQKTLTPEELAAAKNLRRIWDAEKKRSGITQEEAAPFLGLKTQGAVGHYLTGRAAIDADMAIKFAHYLNVSPDEIDIGLSSLPAGTENTEPGPQTKGLIPLISWVAAGAWTTVEDPYEVGDAEKWMPCPVAHGNHTFALRVRGSSMEDEYRDGDIIYIDPSRRPENGSHIVVRLDDSEEATFKRLVMEGGDTYLEALNKSWPERVIKVNGNATIIGVVVFSGRER